MQNLVQSSNSPKIILRCQFQGTTFILLFQFSRNQVYSRAFIYSFIIWVEINFMSQKKDQNFTKAHTIGVLRKLKISNFDSQTDPRHTQERNSIHSLTSLDKKVCSSCYARSVLNKEDKDIIKILSYTVKQRNRQKIAK